MPYAWTDPDPDSKTEELRLWPHQSLQPRGFVLFIGATMVMFLFPLFAVLGTVILWALLPFLLVAVAGIWFALNRNRRDKQVLEVLTLSRDRAHLLRRDPDGREREWEYNRYWTQPHLYPTGGPVPCYVTLTGGGREVEIGAFLSEEERKALHRDLLVRLQRAA